MNKSTPDKLYHGSNVKFNKFDLNKIGSNVGTSGAGAGLYFSSSIEEAITYGKYIYVVDFESLNLKKTLSNFKRTLNKNQIITILDQILNETKGDENYYQNYDEYTYQNYKNKTNIKLKNDISNEIFESLINSTDTEIISSFINSGSIRIPTLLNVLNKMGYNYTMDQYDDNLFKNSQHYILYFEPKIEEKLTFKDDKSFDEYIEKFIIK